MDREAGSLLYDKLADLPLQIDESRLEPLELDVGSWVRRSTLVRLSGAGHEGVGEDVTYERDDQLAFRKRGVGADLRGHRTLDAFCRSLDDFELFPSPQGAAVSRRYRRWAFESAALDLALRQNGESLAGLLGIEPSPVAFALSCGLDGSNSLDPLKRRLDRYPESRFKLDFAAGWTAELVDELAAAGFVDVVDLKGLYRGTFSGPAADATLYRLVAEGLPTTWLEDPELNPETTSVLKPYRNRITWDVPLHSVADIALSAYRPRMINVKPSRFGSISELFAVYEYCAGHGIGMYGGGQFELGVGRGQCQVLASLFHPDTPNDIAPVGYHATDLPAGLPVSPLAPRPSKIGFRWEDRSDV